MIHHPLAPENGAENGQQFHFYESILEWRNNWTDTLVKQLNVLIKWTYFTWTSAVLLSKMSQTYRS